MTWFPAVLQPLTAGGSSERPVGMLPELPIRIGRLELKINTMVTPAENYSILVGNEWLRMSCADLLLSKGVLRIRLDAEQWEEIPIDAEPGERQVNTYVARSNEQRPPVPSSADSPGKVQQFLHVLEQDKSWRRFPDLPVTTLVRSGVLGESVQYDMQACKAFTGFAGPFSWDKFTQQQLQ